MNKTKLTYAKNMYDDKNGPTKSRPEPSGTVRSRPDAARSRPDIVRRPTPPGAVQRPPHQTGKCPRIRLQLGDVNISKL